MVGSGRKYCLAFGTSSFLRLMSYQLDLLLLRLPLRLLVLALLVFEILNLRFRVSLSPTYPDGVGEGYTPPRGRVLVPQTSGFEHTPTCPSAQPV